MTIAYSLPILSSDAARCHLVRVFRWQCKLFLPESDPAPLHLPTTLPPLVAYSRYGNTLAPAGSLGRTPERALRIVGLVGPC